MYPLVRIGLNVNQLGKIGGKLMATKRTRHGGIGDGGGGGN